ncbi:hypothetical protein Plec18167_001746 [Paecilomyces lecythidis]|uniref:AT DNA binding protein n=1 Tax=Paecilomyces lecythidis TaxID=3004212 RepID=A0ABR3YAJ7_9EURO
MTSREPSSSPDILGPPGDAAYLISSPMKPFAGRQSWLSPAVFKTPRKRPRASLSPSKASHSIQFDDIILPGSPTMNIDGRQRSISPSKLQSEGNLSPWRIRVTVQAEQEDQMDDGGSPRRRLLTPGAKTMKIPLKDDSGMYEPSPKRRRGRPRKSDIQNELVTPRKGTPARAKGSPGYTPGPAVPGSTGKRKRGRPRKSLPDQSVVESVETDRFHTVTETSQTPPPEEPLDLAADGASDDGDGYDDIWNPSALGYSEEPNNANLGHSPTPPERQQQQYSSPDRQPAETTHTTDILATSSPTREQSSPRRPRPNAVSPNHTQHAGHTPRPRRIYPTPTSSSVVEEESSATQKRSPHKETRHEQASEHLPDPTDEHREFDTIIESEGFSMVSLDTLPSAKQLALNSSTNAPKGALKPFFNRQSGTGSEKKPRVSFDSHAAVLEVDSASSHQIQSAPERVPVKDLSPPTSSNSSDHENATVEQTSAVQHSTLQLPSEPVEAGRPDGEEFAESQRESEERLKGDDELHRLNEVEEEEEDEIDMVATEIRPESSPARTPNSSPQKAFTGRETGSAILSQRQAEWQREREAVSREIQSANSNRIIVIEDDADAQQPSDDNDEAEPEDVPEEDYDIWQEEANLSHSHLSSRSLSRENGSSQQRQTDSSPWKRGEDVDQENNVDIPPAPWERQQGDMPYLGKSRLGRLREEEVDLSVLLQKKNSPNTRKYYGYSSPQTSTSQHAPSSAARTPATSKSYQATSSPRVDLSSPVRPAAAKSSPQAFSGPQSERETEPENSPARSPSQSLRQSNSQWDENIGSDDDHVMSHGLESEQGQHEEMEMSDERADATHNSPSIHEPSALTPPPEQQENHAPASGSWFRRLSNFTPGWWGSASPEKEHVSRHEKEENDRAEEDDEEELEEEGKEDDENWDDVHNQLPQSQDGPVRREVEYPSLPRSPDVQSAKTERTYKQSVQRKPLSVSGYFTNDHYKALYRLYRLAKRSPELFPYYPNEERTEIIGDWLWTADGDYGLPVTELQFAIIDKFVDDLAEADIRNGGSGEIGWSEEELHKRLFSIIVGEQIRKDRKARTQEAAAGMMQNGYTLASSRSRYRS